MISKIKFSQISLYLLSFLIPTQLAFHTWPDYAFVFGLRVDYLSPAIYLTDILVFAILVANIKQILKWVVENNKFIFFVFALLFINIYISEVKIISLIKWLKIFEFFFLGLTIYMNNKYLNKNTLYNIIFFSALFFGVIGAFQVFLGKTTGYFWLLGERSFTSNSPGIALSDFFGNSTLRSYSTFPHPNSFAGYLGVVLLLLSEKFQNDRKYIFIFGSLLLPFFLTFSASGVFAFTVCLLLLLVIKNVKLNIIVTVFTVLLSLISLVLAFLSQQIFPLSKLLGLAVYERVELMFYAKESIASHFWFGTGLNTFIPMATLYVGVLGNSWILQPVHNIFLLVFSELGATGILIYFFIINFFIKYGNKTLNTLLFFILLTSFLDHYWFTLQQNMLLLAVVIPLNLNYKN